MNNNEARKLGITDEELGIAQPDLDYHMPDEQIGLPQQKSTNDVLPQQNAEPVPPGTPDKIARCFRAIPHEQVQNYKQLYATFEHQDMPFPEFCVEMAFVNSPIMMQKDLEAIHEQRMMGYSRKQAIDRAIKAGGISKAHRN